MSDVERDHRDGDIAVEYDCRGARVDMDANSAAGVTLPSSKQAPPMITSSATVVATSGALTSAMAILVNGPIAHNVIVPGSAARKASIRKSDTVLRLCRHSRLGH
jgi:hypothetical protein